MPVLVGLLLASNTLAQEKPAASTRVFADTFSAPAEGKAALAGRDLAQAPGKTPWRVGGALVLAPGGGVTCADEKGGVAWHPIPVVSGSVLCSASVKLTGIQTCFGLAIGGNIGGKFFADSQLQLLISKSGNWEIDIPAVKDKKRVAGGAKADIPHFDADGQTQIRLDYDSIHKTVSASLNGKLVVDSLDLNKLNVEIKADSAGFRLNGTLEPGASLVRDYQLTLTTLVTGGIQLLDPAASIITADRAIQLKLKASSVPDNPQPAAYVVRDYLDRTVVESKAPVSADGSITLPLNLPQGFYELQFTDSHDALGLYATAAVDGKADLFFGIDTALSQLVPSADTRQACIDMLTRVGIHNVRERYQLAIANPAQDKWNWDASERKQDSMRQMYAKGPIKILDMLWGTPKFHEVDEITKYPKNQPLAGASWTNVITRYSGNWLGWEVSNEPDLNVAPADQYASLVKVASYAAERAKLASPVISGVFATSPPGTFFETCAANGMLDDSDAVSFHSYDNATEMEGLIAHYRQWLKASGHESMPLWNTECGKPWPTGRARPTTADDAASALQITMKAVEAKACGVARYYPFVLVAYFEKDRAFGMIDGHATPLRQFAAYAFAASALRDAKYIGDLKVTDPAVRLARVFVTPAGQKLAVLFTGALKEGATVHLDIPAQTIAGIDGRPLPPGDGGAIPIADGLTYVYLDPPAGAVLSNTPAAALLAVSETAQPQKRIASPVVLRLSIPGTTTQYSQRRYMVTKDNLTTFKLTVAVSNLSDSMHHATLRLVPPGVKGAARPAAQQPMEIDLPPMAVKEVQWSIDLTPFVDVAETRFLLIEGSCDNHAAISTLAVPLVTEGDLPTHLARYPVKIPLPIALEGNWIKNCAAGGKASFSSPDSGFQMNIEFPQKSPGWAFPKFTIPDGTDLSQATGLLMRVRITHWSRHVGIMLTLDGDRKESFEFLELFPPDGQWHVIYVPFEELKPQAGHPDGQNARFNPSRLKIFSVGMVTDKGENELDLSHLYAVGGAR